MNTDEQIKEKLTQIDAAWTQFKEANDKLVSKAVKDALAEAHLDNIQQSIDDLTGKREDLEKRFKAEVAFREDLERKYNALRIAPSAGDINALGKKELAKQRHTLECFNRETRAHAKEKGQEVPAEATMEQYQEYRKAFRAYMRHDTQMMTPDQTRAMQVGVDPDGGFLVPADLSGQIVTALFDLSPIRQIASVQQISSDRLDGIEDLGEVSTGWVSEIAARPTTANPQIGKWEIVAQELYASPQATQRLLDDANIDAEGWLAAKVADKFARVEGAAFIVGTGVGQPRGLTTYPTAATGDNTRAWGTFERVNTGQASGFAADPNGGDILFDLIAAFRPPYLNNARWLTRRSVIAKVRKMKATTGNYLWQPGLTLGAPDSILGFPITLAEDMPALASTSLSMCLGDFKQAYQIVDRLGVRTLRDPFTNKPYVIFYTTKRTGGGVLNFQALKFVQFS